MYGNEVRMISYNVEDEYIIVQYYFDGGNDRKWELLEFKYKWGGEESIKFWNRRATIEYPNKIEDAYRLIKQGYFLREAEAIDDNEPVDFTENDLIEMDCGDFKKIKGFYESVIEIILADKEFCDEKDESLGSVEFYNEEIQEIESLDELRREVTGIYCNKNIKRNPNVCKQCNNDKCTRNIFEVNHGIFTPHMYKKCIFELEHVVSQ